MLFGTCRNLPLVGPAITAAYVGSLVKDLVKQGKDSPAKPELINLGVNELEGALNDAANALYDESVGKIVSENNVPDMIHNPIKARAIGELIGVMRSKIQQKIPGGSATAPPPPKA